MRSITARFIAGLATAAATSLAMAQSHPMHGSFSGKETLTVSRCTDKTSTSQWQATFSVDGMSYSGQGGSTDGGTFTFLGKLDGTKATGTVEGRTPEGRLWKGKTQAVVAENGKLQMQIDGTVPMTDCRIAVSIEAAKSSIQ